MDNTEKNPDISVTKGFASGVIARRWLIAAIFAAIIIILNLIVPWKVHIENNILAYLPENDAASFDASDEALTADGRAEIVVEYISTADAELLCGKMREVPGVERVLFDPETDHAENSALITVCFDSKPQSDACTGALNEVLGTVGSREYCVCTDIGAGSDTAGGMKLVLIIFSAAVLLVLLLTTRSLAEILVIAVTLLAAVMLNKGTDFILRSTSYISDELSLVLQVALSAAGALVMSGRFADELAGSEPKEAAAAALKASAPAILAAGLTTAAALFAMTLMRFGLGADLGYALIKAVLCSLLTVLLFMPALLSIFGKAVNGSRHGRFLPGSGALGKFAWSGRRVMPIVFALLLAESFVITRNADYDCGLSFTNGAESEYAREMIETRFGGRSTLTVLVPAGDHVSQKALSDELSALDEVAEVSGLCTAESSCGYMLTDLVAEEDLGSVLGTDPSVSQAIFAYYAAENFAHNELEESEYTVPLIEMLGFIHDKCLLNEAGSLLGDEQVELVNTLYDEFSAVESRYESGDYTRLTVCARLPVQGQGTCDFIDRIRLIAGEYYDGDIHVTGDAVTDYGLGSSFDRDGLLVPLLAAGLAFVIMIFAFRAVLLPLMITLVSMCAVWLDLAVFSLGGNRLSFICCLIACAVLTGANAACAIFIASRCRELCESSESGREAMEKTMELMAPTVIGSGLVIFAAGFVTGSFVSDGITAFIGALIGVGALIGMALQLFVLPQLMQLFGRSIKAVPRAVSEKTNAVLRRSLGFALALISVVTAVLVPLTRQRVSAASDSTVKQCSEQLSSIASLESINSRLDKVHTQYEDLKLLFAESYVTEHYGKEQIENSEEQYFQGSEQLANGESAYAQSKARYEEWFERYRIALEEYNAGKAQYEAGLAEYNAALEQYNAAKAQLDRVMGIYNAAMPLYNAYKQQEEAYQAALERGNELIAGTLYPLVTAGRAAFETSLGGYGSLGALLDYLSAAKAELSAAEAELNAAEQVLEAARLRLEELENFLTESEEQLNAAKEQLAATRQQLDIGYSQLSNAGTQIDEGKKRIEQNEELLEGSLASLDQYADEAEKLAKGTELLLEVPAVRRLVGNSATCGEICSAAKSYYGDLMTKAQRQDSISMVAGIVFAAAAVLALIAAISVICGKNNFLSFILAILSAFGSAAGVVLWKKFCTGYAIIPVLAAVLCVLAIVCAEYIFKHRTVKTDGQNDTAELDCPERNDI